MCNVLRYKEHCVIIIFLHRQVAPAMQNAPQVLVIPQDAGRWSALQKSLVVGGVYHVMAHTGQRKYCLWNGTQLVPCKLTR